MGSGGRKTTPETRDEIVRLRLKGMPVRQVAAKVGVAKTTVQRIMKATQQCATSDPLRGDESVEVDDETEQVQRRLVRDIGTLIHNLTARLHAAIGEGRSAIEVAQLSKALSVLRTSQAEARRLVKYIEGARAESVEYEPVHEFKTVDNGAAVVPIGSSKANSTAG